MELSLCGNDFLNFTFCILRLCSEPALSLSKGQIFVFEILKNPAAHPFATGQ